MDDVVMYDGLVSVIQELELMLHSHNRIFGSDSTSWSCSCRKQDIQIVYDAVSSMYSLLIDSDYNLLENDIISAVHDAQDYVDSFFHGCCSDPNTENQTAAVPGRSIDDLRLLHSVIKYKDSIHKSPQLTWSSPETGHELFAVQSLIKTGNQGVESMSATEEVVARMIFNLTGEPGFNICSITGSGKATFIRRVYDHPALVFSHFSIRAWLTIRPGDTLRYVLIRLLLCVDSSGSKMINYDTTDNDELAQLFYKRLKHRRYVIVLNDHLYDSTIWDYLKRYFPDDKNGSRIIILTGATNATPHSPRHNLSRSSTSKHESHHQGSNIQKLTKIDSFDLRFLHLLKKLNHDERVFYGAPQNYLEDFIFEEPWYMKRDPAIMLNLVGHEKDIWSMRDLLFGRPSKLKVFAVTGTGGIGKTAFTKRLYDDPSFYSHFRIRAWFTISKHYQVRESLIDILYRYPFYSMTELETVSNNELREQLHKILKGKRYLIVLDDMCDKSAWDDWKRAFPDDNNGSRVMLTSRLRDVAIHASPDTPPHCLSSLNLDESWKLLCSKIFGKESCPSELKSIGKKIAFLCRGLPLAIILIGLYLSQMNKTTEIWNEVVLLLARGVTLDDAEQKLGCCQASNIEVVFSGAARTANSRCLHSVQESIGSMKKELKNIQDDQEVLYKEPQNLQDTSSAGKFSLVGCFLSTMNNAFKCFKKAESSLVSGEKHNDVERVVGCYQGSNIETQTDILDSAVGTVNSRCLRIQEKIESIKKELKKIRNDKEILQKALQNLADTTPAGNPFTVLKSMHGTPKKEDKLVGLEKDLLTMLDHLTGHPLKRKVFAVTGMGGIGKTTFIKRLYDDPLITYHFNCRAWFTISQQYRVREVLIGLLRCLTDVVTEIYEQDNEKLRQQLYQSLKGKRYLIVLDDMWDENVWDDLNKIFPDDENGSRILLTSRHKDVAIHASPDTPPHCLSFLREDESWELLQSKVFANESCPLELESIGKQIAVKCHGLPLAIVVVGGLLSKLNKTLEVWQQFAQSVSSQVMEKAEHCKSILALSYKHLPHYLKVCFLYLGIFPEDYVIPVQTLIWLWIAEGFIRPGMVKSLEELAEEYLEDLVSRNLIMVKRRKPEGRSKICYIHDLLRDLSLTESQNQNFLHLYGSVERKEFPWEMQRRLCFQSNIPDHDISSSFPSLRSFLLFKTLSLRNNEKFWSMKFKLLKVMDIRNLHLEELPREILGLTYLRHLSITIQDPIDISIFSSKMHNLQILIIESDWNGRLPKEFWDMSEIRHLQFKRCFLSYWPDECRPNILQLSSESEIPLKKLDNPLKVLHNLQSLTAICPISCTESVFLSMPNLKKLGIYENEEDYMFRGWFRNLIFLQELQTLKYIFGNPFVTPLMKPGPLPLQEFFPPKLMKLTLSGTSLPWEDMIKLSKLPNLEVLKLKNYAFSGAIWKSEDGGFTRLKYLLIGKTNLQVWEADGFLFPSLQHLVMMHCRLLKEIPYSIGEAPLLEKIELHYCSESAATSALQIQSVQEDSGNDGLTVTISKMVDKL